MARPSNQVQPSDIKMAAPPARPRGRQPGEVYNPIQESEIKGLVVGQRPANQTIRFGRPSPPRRPLNWFVQRVIDVTLDRPEDTPEEAKDRAESCVWIEFNADVVKKLTNQIQGWNGRKRTAAGRYPGVKITWSYAFNETTGAKTHVAFWAVRKPAPMPGGGEGEAPAAGAPQQDAAQPQPAAPPPPPPAPAAAPRQAPAPVSVPTRWTPRA